MSRETWLSACPKVNFHLFRNMFFSLLDLEGIHHYWKYVFSFFFSRGLSKWKLNAPFVA